MNIIEQREFYNKHWSDDQYQNSLKLARASKIIEGIVKTRLKKPRMADLGCGSGWLPAILGHFGPTLGLELSDEAINKAREKYPYVSYESSDVFDWKNPENEFDIVVSQEVLEHVEDQPGYLKIASTMLKKGGFLILTTPNKSTFDHMPADVVKSWSNQPIENWLTMHQLRMMVKEQFNIIELSSIITGYGNRGSYKLINSNLFRKVCRAIGLASWHQRFRENRGFGLHLYVLAQKTN